MKSKIIRSGTLAGTLTQNGATKRLIVICHGYKSSSKNKTLVAITDGLTAAGHATFTFDFSKNTGGFDIEQQVNDIAHIAEYFEDYDELVLLAASFAALPAAIATIKLAKVKGLITVNGFFGSSALGPSYRGTYRKFRLAALVVPTYRKIMRYMKQELRPADNTVPVLIIHSKADQDVLPQQSEQFFASVLGNKQLTSLESADHGITSPQDQKVVIAIITDWLSKQC